MIARRSKSLLIMNELLKMLSNQKIDVVAIDREVGERHLTEFNFVFRHDYVILKLL